MNLIAILAALALPSYQEQVRKCKRAEGKARLAQSAQLLERYYSDNNTYIVAAGFPTLLALTAGSTVYSGSNNEATSAYTITIAATASTYTLTAAPAGAQAGDTKCASLTLTNTGLKAITGTGAVTDCW